MSLLVSVMSFGPSAGEGFDEGFAENSSQLTSPGTLCQKLALLSVELRCDRVPEKVPCSSG